MKKEEYRKEDIRTMIKARKALLSEADRLTAAASAFARLEETAAFMLAENVLMYHSLPDELSTLDFLRKWSGRKHFFLPRVNGLNLEILPYEETNLALGAFHIEEPTGNNTADIESIELIVVPGVAFDRNGNRIGRGKGYYDRLLKSSKATTVGIGYDFQFMLDDIPVEEHDIPLDIVITDRRKVSVKSRRKHRR